METVMMVSGSQALLRVRRVQELVAENEKRQKSGTVGVAPPERNAPPDPMAVKKANIQTEAARSSCPPIAAGDEP